MLFSYMFLSCRVLSCLVACLVLLRHNIILSCHHNVSVDRWNRLCRPHSAFRFSPPARVGFLGTKTWNSTKIPELRFENWVASDGKIYNARRSMGFGGLVAYTPQVDPDGLVPFHSQNCCSYHRLPKLKIRGVFRELYGNNRS